MLLCMMTMIVATTVPVTYLSEGDDGQFYHAVDLDNAPSSTAPGSLFLAV
jgi:hypothetical protein